MSNLKASSLFNAIIKTSAFFLLSFFLALTNPHKNWGLITTVKGQDTTGQYNQAVKKLKKVINKDPTLKAEYQRLFGTTLLGGPKGGETFESPSRVERKRIKYFDNIKDRFANQSNKESFSKILNESKDLLQKHDTRLGRNVGYEIKIEAEQKKINTATENIKSADTKLSKTTGQYNQTVQKMKKVINKNSYLKAEYQRLFGTTIFGGPQGANTFESPSNVEKKRIQYFDQIKDRFTNQSNKDNFSKVLSESKELLQKHSANLSEKIGYERTIESSKSNIKELKTMQSSGQPLPTEKTLLEKRTITTTPKVRGSVPLKASTQDLKSSNKQAKPEAKPKPKTLPEPASASNAPKKEQVSQEKRGLRVQSAQKKNALIKELKKHMKITPQIESSLRKMNNAKLNSYINNRFSKSSKMPQKVSLLLKQYNRVNTQLAGTSTAIKGTGSLVIPVSPSTAEAIGKADISRTPQQKAKAPPSSTTAETVIMERAPQQSSLQKTQVINLAQQVQNNPATIKDLPKEKVTAIRLEHNSAIDLKLGRIEITSQSSLNRIEKNRALQVQNATDKFERLKERKTQQYLEQNHRGKQLKELSFWSGERRKARKNIKAAVQTDLVDYKNEIKEINEKAEKKTNAVKEKYQKSINDLSNKKHRKNAAFVSAITSEGLRPERIIAPQETLKAEVKVHNDNLDKKIERTKKRFELLIEDRKKLAESRKAAVLNAQNTIKSEMSKTNKQITKDFLAKNNARSVHQLTTEKQNLLTNEILKSNKENRFSERIKEAQNQERNNKKIEKIEKELKNFTNRQNTKMAVEIQQLESSKITSEKLQAIKSNIKAKQPGRIRSFLAKIPIIGSLGTGIRSMTQSARQWNERRKFRQKQKSQITSEEAAARGQVLKTAAVGGAILAGGSIIGSKIIDSQDTLSSEYNISNETLAKITALKTNCEKDFAHAQSGVSISTNVSSENFQKQIYSKLQNIFPSLKVLDDNVIGEYDEKLHCYLTSEQFKTYINAKPESLKIHQEYCPVLLEIRDCRQKLNKWAKNKINQTSRRRDLKRYEGVEPAETRSITREK